MPVIYEDMDAVVLDVGTGAIPIRVEYAVIGGVIDDVAVLVEAAPGRYEPLPAWLFDRLDPSSLSEAIAEDHGGRVAYERAMGRVA